MRSIPATVLRDYQPLLRDIYTPVPLEEFPANAVRLLSRAVPVDFQGTADMDYANNRFHAVREPALEARDQAELDAVFLAHVRQHPLAASPTEVLGGTEVILSQTMASGLFEKSSLFHEFYQPISVRDELGMSIAAGAGRALCFFLWRAGRGFSAHELETFAFLRPHIEQAYQNAETLARAGGPPSLVEDLGEALSRGLVLLDCQCRVREWSDRGRRLLQKYFPAWRCAPRRLPEPLSAWVCRLIAQATKTRGVAQVREPYQVTGAQGRLTVRLVNRKAEGEFLLIFEEHQDAPPPEILSALGLTPRECTIASWLAQGKTNPEIATILGANIYTIKVHVMHIFHKLGVETRTAAAMHIVECWRTATTG